MLKLRKGVVVSAGDEPRWQHLDVDVAGERRPARADTTLVGRSEPGDEVVVNVEARDLQLGSGGFDVVHVNLTRGLDGEGTPGAHVMKLNYSSLQHAVLPVEREAAGDGPPGKSLGVPLDRPVAVFSLHGQLAPLAWALAQTKPGTRAGYVQTAGGALPGAMSDTVKDLRERGLLADHVTAAPAFGGEHEAITTAGAIHHGLTEASWDVALVGPGPGILGSGSALGHGGLAALDSAHAALALGCPTLLVPRMSESDPRKRHRNLSHHTRTVLELVLGKVTVPVPVGAVGAGFETARERGHEVREAPADLSGYRSSGLPTRTMGRTIDEDQLFFAAALAAGSALGAMLE
jgi:uncharacterized protein DUF3866